MSNAIEKTEKYYMPVFSRQKLVLDHGRGVYVYDENGKEYLDCLAGIAVNGLGYAHPAMLKALSEQAAKLMHTSNIFYSQVQADLVEKLCTIAGFDKVFLANSGAEANEGALKLARKYGHTISDSKIKIVTANHSFHGRTMMTMTATGQPKYQQGYAPLPEGFSYVDFGDIQQLEAAMDDDVCAVLLEVIQGEGGVNVASKDYFEQVRKLCDKHNALLIFDEIQTGVCRTGQWFAYQGIGIKPDIMTMAKALGCGYPIGAFLTDDKWAKYFKPGDHGGTFGGNQLGCAVALAVLDFMQSEHMADQAAKKGIYFMQKLHELKAQYPELIADVRGRGLIIGIELAAPNSDLVAKCLAKGLIINVTAGKVIRLVPPLIINKEEIDKVCAILAECLGA